MLAPADLPLRYRWFNFKWGAPRGRIARAFVRGQRRATRLGSLAVGCFAFQTNNTTRAFEYPWAFEALALRPGMRVLEIGGSLSGFQFVLDHAGCEVVDVDPGDEFHASGWPVTPETVATLNRLFGTKVTLLNKYLEDAEFPAGSFDRVVSLSVIEHVPVSSLERLLAEVHRILKPGGLLVMTVDLFLNVRPFTEAASNIYGHNVSLKWLVETSGLQLVHGDRRELFGYPEFSAETIRQRRPEFLVGKYPAMVQTVVLQKAQQ